MTNQERYERMLIYLKALEKEVYQGAQEGSFSIEYIKEKLAKFKHDAEMQARENHEPQPEPTYTVKCSKHGKIVAGAGYEEAEACMNEHKIHGRVSKEVEL